MNGSLIIRADAGPKIGAGHVMRCLALAQTWRDSGGAVRFVTAHPPAPIREGLRAEGIECVETSVEPGSAADLGELRRIGLESPGAWVVVDGYQFDESYQRQLKEAGLRLLVVDDYGHAKHYWADLVLNQNLGVKADLYRSQEAYTRLLLGHRYVLLRREFLKWRDRERVFHEPHPLTPSLSLTGGERAGRAGEGVTHILVTLGGGDTGQVTLKILQALHELQVLPAEATVLTGDSNPLQPALAEASRTVRFPIRLVSGVSSMAQVMAEADVAIAAGGTTAWELAFMGLPSLLVTLAKNQVQNAEQLDAMGVARNLGWHEALSPSQLAETLAALISNSAAREEMSRRGRSLIDGRGASRVWLHLNEVRLTLRPVNESDCRQLWKWANAPEVRAVSFSNEPISWERHVEWFESRLREPQGKFWLAAFDQNQPIGQVRFDSGEESGTAVISMSLDAAYRGQGLGALLIWNACRKLFAETSFQRIRALVKPENDASRRAFEKADFNLSCQTVIKGQTALVYELAKA